MFHLAAYTTALGVGTDIDIPALSDDILTIQNTHFVLSQPLRLIAADAFSPLLDRVKIASPSMRQIAAPFIRPLFNGTTHPTNPNMMLLDSNPFQLVPFEEIQVQATSTIGAMTERFTSLLWLQPSMEMVPQGNVIPLRFTSTGTATANAWTTLSLTFADTLPTGTYAVVLSEHFSATAQAHRWIFSNQVWRPGYPSYTTTVMRQPYAISKGQFGIMGTFRSNDVPRFQVLCNGADVTDTGYMHVVRIGSIY